MLTFGLDPNTSEGIMSMNGSRNHLNDLYASKVWPSILFLSLVMLTGSAGNLLVCVVYRCDLSKVNNRFILALTGIDLINCLISIPGELADLRYRYSFGDSSYCPAMRFFQTFCSLGSGGILVTISVDRFQKICKPFDKQTTLQASAAAIFVCVILSLLCASPAAVISGRKTKLVNGVWTADCSIADAYISAQIYNGFLFFLFICGCLILIVLYSLIWKRLRKQKRYRMRVAHAPASTTSTSLARNQRLNAKDVRENESSESGSSTSTGKILTSKEHYISGSAEKNDETMINGGDNDEKENKPSTLGTSAVTESPSNVNKSTSTRSVEKTTLMMLMVTVVFILSFLPYLCLATAQAVDRKSFKNLTNVQHVIYNLFLRSHFLNSVLNPFIYSFFSLQFKKQVQVFRRSVMRKVGLG